MDRRLRRLHRRIANRKVERVRTELEAEVRNVTARAMFGPSYPYLAHLVDLLNDVNVPRFGVTLTDNNSRSLVERIQTMLAIHPSGPFTECLNAVLFYLQACDVDGPYDCRLADISWSNYQVWYVLLLETESARIKLARHAMLLP